MHNTREKLIELLMDKPFGNSTEERETAHAHDVADYLIDNGVTVQKWIPVTERLPDCADTVLAVDGDGIRATAYYVGYWHSGGELDEYAITHWMPLPEPPEGE